MSDNIATNNIHIDGNFCCLSDGRLLQVSLIIHHSRYTRPQAISKAVHAKHAIPAKKIAFGPSTFVKMMPGMTSIQIIAIPAI